MSTIDWHARVAALTMDGRALINGERVYADVRTLHQFIPSAGTVHVGANPPSL